MKKLGSLFLTFVLFFSVTTRTFAADSVTTDTASYVEAETGDVISLEAVTVTSTDAASRNLSTNVYATRIFRNGVLEETLYVDFANNVLRHEYSNEIAFTEALSDVVIISEISPSTDDSTLAPFLTASDLEGTRAIDYVDGEPLTVSESGVQDVLSGAAYYSGYQAMGYRGGYNYAPTTFGYLQRKNAGVVGTYHSHRFDFSLGTEIGTAASIICAYFTNNNVVGLTASIASALLGPIIDAAHAWSTVFEVKRYEWQYRIRLNSNTGAIIGTNFRTRDYWKSYNPATGAVSHKYRGASFDTGCLLFNHEMIKLAIDAYLQG